MQKKVFKYKFVYWISITITLIFSTLFGFASINRIVTNSFLNIRDFTFSILIILNGILSIVSLFCLIVKNKKSIKFIRYMLIMMIVIFTIGLFDSIFIKKNFGKDLIDYILLPICYLIIGGLFILFKKYKFEDKSAFMEIEEIGTQ